MEMHQSQVLWATRTFEDEAWDEPEALAMLRAGVIGGLVGGVVMWIYQALVWVGVQHLIPLSDIPANPVGLVFGQHVQLALGPWAYLAGTALHVFAALIWGMLFAIAWPYMRRRDYEATLVGLGFAVIGWAATRVAVAMISRNSPGSVDPLTNIAYLIAQIFFAVPMALTVKKVLSDDVP